MVDKEIYYLTKHGKFQADYVEKIPIYRRRNFLSLLTQEFEDREKEQNKIQNRNKVRR